MDRAETVDSLARIGTQQCLGLCHSILPLSGRKYVSSAGCKPSVRLERLCGGRVCIDQSILDETMHYERKLDHVRIEWWVGESLLSAWALPELSGLIDFGYRDNGILWRSKVSDELRSAELPSIRYSGRIR